MSGHGNIRGIACGIFREEIEHLIRLGTVSASFTFVDSDLHMYPQELERVLGELIEPGCFLCYGQCHARMKEQQDCGIITRVSGLNCCEILLGRADYRRLRAGGAFFLLPEWTMKWEHVFKELLGFTNPALAAQFMNEMHTKLIYLDTGVTPVPHDGLRDIAEYCSLPVEILAVDLSHLAAEINKGFISRNDNES